MFADHLTARGDERSGYQRRRIGGKMLLEHRHVVVVRDETDLDRFLLIRSHQSQPPGDRASLLLGEIAHRRQHAVHHRAIDPPQEVRLILLAVAAAEQRATVGDRVMPGRNRIAVERVGVIEEVPELREGVAAHAGNGRAPARVFGHEIVDHVVPEPVLEIEDVVWNAELVRHQLRVGDRVEGAAGTVGDGVAVTEQLHRRADHVVTLFDEQGRGDRGIDAARHRNEHSHRCSTADKDRTFSTILGSAAATAATSSSLLSIPNEKRSAATPSSRGTRIAVSTCDGSTVPVLQADPDEQAIPARSRCISNASLSVPGMDTFEMCGARAPCQPLIRASGTMATRRRSSSSRSSPSRVARPCCSSAARRAAMPNPTMPGTFSVPGRIPNCWPPPLGAPILWPEMVRKVQLTSRSDTGTLPNAWTASE